MAQEIALFKSAIFLVGLLADVRLGEFHQFQAQVTDFTIENGDTVGDHIALLPDVVEIQLQMSNFDADGLPLLGLRAATFLQTLRAAQRAREIYDVLTQHHLHQDMAIESITGDHTAPFRGRLDITIRFKRVDRIQLAFTELPESQLAEGGTAKSAASPVDGGRQDVVTQADDRSTFARIVDAFGGA